MEQLPPKEAMCHCAWFEKSCRDLVVSGACRRWVNVRGMHPQTGTELDRWDCVDNQIPVLLMSIGKLTSEAGAATESFRNEVVSRSDRLRRAAPRPLESLPGDEK